MDNPVLPAPVSAVRKSEGIGKVLSRFQGLAGLLIILGIALLASPRSSGGALIFLEPGNITDILRQVSEIGIISLGMTFVILTGGIDLSVGSALALSSSIAGLVLTRSANSSIAVAITAAIVCTTLL